MDRKFEENIETYKKAVSRIIDNDIERCNNQKIELLAEKTRLENLLDENDKQDNLLYKQNLADLEKIEENIKNHKNAAKFSIERIIEESKERNKKIESEYMVKGAGQIQLRINDLQTDNQRLEFDIKHKEVTISDTMNLIEKYKEIKDYDRVAELDKKLNGLKNEVKDLKDQQKTNLDEIDTCKNYAEEYNRNLKTIKLYRDIAKKHDIEIELTNKEKTDTEKADTEKTDTEKTDTEKTDTEKADTEKTDTEKTDTEKTDTEKADTEKTDTEKTDTEKTDTEKTDTEKAEKVGAFASMDRTARRLQEEREKELREMQEQKKSRMDIVVSAKDQSVTINGTEVKNLNIGEVLEKNTRMFRRLGINDIIKQELDTKNIFKILNVRRKIDPVIVAAIDRSDEPKNIEVLKDYIYSIGNKVLSKASEENLDYSIKYDLKDSNLDEVADKKLQKYARHADKVDGIEVEGLKERGPKAWYKAFMNRVTTKKLEKGQGEKTADEDKVTGYKKVDETAKKLQKENESKLREEVKYRQGTMDRFVQSYEELQNEPEFDLQEFMKKASKEMSPSEFSELGRIVNGNRTTGGYKKMDETAQQLSKQNEEELKSKYTKSDGDVRE